MAHKVIEGKDYKILDDDYRKIFKNTYKAKTSIGGTKYYKCIYCGHKTPVDEMQVDHIIPKTRLKAGILWNPNRAWNLGPSCPHCNQSKSNALDKRVFIGFRNKVLSNLNVVVPCKDEEYSEDAKTTRNISLVIAGVSVLVCLVLPLVYLSLGAVSLMYNFLCWATKGTFKIGKGVLTRTTKKILKLLIKHPIRNVIILVGLVYIAKVAPGFYTRLFCDITNSMTALLTIIF